MPKDRHANGKAARKIIHKLLMTVSGSNLGLLDCFARTRNGALTL